MFIDRLRSALVSEKLGATVIPDLVGTIDIPRQTGSSTAQWVGEDGSLTETDATFDDVNLAPKTVGGDDELFAANAVECLAFNRANRSQRSRVDHCARDRQ
jgi:hypothetical protein